jgi:hypothetical protein
MELTPSEQDHLLIFVAAELARSRRNRGLLLNVPEVIAAVGGRSREITSVIELWTPRQSSYEETVALEESWAAQSVKFLRASIGLKA